jgi:hypothetical protein
LKTILNIRRGEMYRWKIMYAVLGTYSIVSTHGEWLESEQEAWADYWWCVKYDQIKLPDNAIIIQSIVEEEDVTA